MDTQTRQRTASSILDPAILVPALWQSVLKLDPRVMIRNPFYPKDMQGPGNVDRVDITVINDNSTLLADYLSGQIDMMRTGTIPDDQVASLKGNSNLTNQLLFLQSTGIEARIVQLPHGHDPNSYFVAGATAADFTQCLERTQPL